MALTALTMKVFHQLTLSTERGNDLNATKESISLAHTFEAVFGTSIGQADEIWYDRRILAVGSEDINLFDSGTLVNPYGEAITFSKIRGLIIINRSTLTWGAHTGNTSNAIKIGAAGANIFVFLSDSSDIIILDYASALMLTVNSSQGWPVNAGAKNLKIDAITAEALYDIVVIGIT